MQFSNLNSIRIHLHTTLRGKGGISNHWHHRLVKGTADENGEGRRCGRLWQGLVYLPSICCIPILLEVLSMAMAGKESVVWELPHHNFGGEKILDQMLG